MFYGLRVVPARYYSQYLILYLVIYCRLDLVPISDMHRCRLLTGAHINISYLYCLLAQISPPCGQNACLMANYSQPRKTQLFHGRRKALGRKWQLTINHSWVICPEHHKWALEKLTNALKQIYQFAYRTLSYGWS